MFRLEGELAREYLSECRAGLASIETDLLILENDGAQIDEQLVARVFRALHSIKGGAGVFNLVKLGELAHGTEDVLALIRSRELVPTPELVGVLLLATDQLLEMIREPATSNEADLSVAMAALSGLLKSDAVSTGEQRQSARKRVPPVRPLRILLVEDDFISRLVLQSFLTPYGQCHIAVNGVEAVEAFRATLERGESYDLICMDIMMPEMDGREAVRHIRATEEAHGVLSTRGVKIIMTTAVGDIQEVIRCFRELCDAYLIKPIDLSELLSHMLSLGLVQ